MISIFSPHQRRKTSAIFRLIAIGLVTIAISTPAFANIRFYSLPRSVSPTVDDYSQRQYYDEWCWAASVHMAYKAQGAEVSQYRIVDAIKGIIVDAPAQPSEIVSALTALGTDDHGILFNSNAALFQKVPSGRFRNINPLHKVTEIEASQLGLIAAFLVCHGIPVLAMYHPSGPASGHCVLISGVSLDSRSANAVSYQVDDPWPLDDAGDPITVDSAVRKQMDAGTFESELVGFIIPFVFTPTSVDEMRQVAADLARVVAAERADAIHSLSSIQAIGAFQPTEVNYPDVEAARQALGISDVVSNASSNQQTSTHTPTTDDDSWIDRENAEWIAAVRGLWKIKRIEVWVPFGNYPTNAVVPEDSTGTFEIKEVDSSNHNWSPQGTLQVAVKLHGATDTVAANTAIDFGDTLVYSKHKVRAPATGQCAFSTTTDHSTVQFTDFELAVNKQTTTITLYSDTGQYKSKVYHLDNGKDYVQQSPVVRLYLSHE